MSLSRSGAPRPAANPNLAVPPDPSSPLRRREGPAMRAVRHAWNALVSLLLGAMIGFLGHQFAADAIARLWPHEVLLADLARLAFWLLGSGAAVVLFLSYYLDDTGR